MSIAKEPQPSVRAATSSSTQSGHPHHTTNIRRIGIGDEPNCNVSAESLQPSRTGKKNSETACPATDGVLSSQGKDNKICNKSCRSKRWTKSRHKYTGPPSIDPDQSVAPLFVSNILDKL